MPGAFFGISVEVDTRVLDALIPTAKPTASALIRKHAFEFEGYAKAFAPVDTSALRNSINISQLGELSATISDGVEYGVYQEFGVNHPYLIDAPVYIRGVGFRYIKMHPGFPAQPFFTPAAERVGRTFFSEYFPIWLGSA